MRFSVLQMAEAWGMHPEDVLQHPRSVRWAAWFGVYQDEKAKAERAAQKKKK